MILPARSWRLLTVQSVSFWVSRARVSSRYVAKSYFSLRSSVTVTLEMKASASPESIRTKFCAQSAALYLTSRPSTLAMR